MIREKVLNYFKGDNLATDVFINKYSLNKKELPKDMLLRIVQAFNTIESKYFDLYKNNINEDARLIADCHLSKYGKERIEKQLNSSSQSWESYIYKFFKDFKYIVPGGSVMQGLNSDKPVSLSNCFVLPSPEDNVESIYDTIRNIAQISKRRGGVGIDISKLRPRGAKVDNANNSSTGAVSFMESIDKATEVIGQEGRRRALMISIDVNHPDIFEFANIKKDLTKITGANISIKLNNKFLEAVKNDSDYILRYPCNNLDIIYDPKELEYNKLKNSSFYLDNIECKVFYKKIRARELWDTIIKNAHSVAEPGIFNWERLINYDPTEVYSELVPITTNPCGELGLSGGDSCRLIATNLYSLVKDPFTKLATIDTELAYSVFYEAQILADNLVDLEIEAVDKILCKINPTYNDLLDYCKDNNYNILHHYSEWESSAVGITEEFKLWWKIRNLGYLGRRTGTGVTAYADMLAALGKEYGNSEITEQIFKLKLQAELDATIDLAILRGTFPLWDKNKEFSKHVKHDDIKKCVKLHGNNDWYQFLVSSYPEQAERMYKYGRRNSGLSTIAPTGSLSIMTQTSSGIEPIFLPLYKRKVTCLNGEKPDIVEQGIGYTIVPVIHPKLKTWYEAIGKEVYMEYLGNGISEIPKLEELSYNDWEFLLQYSPYYKQSSADIDSKVRVDTQALIQKYITSSISSTVNLPNDVSVKTVNDLYLDAFNKGCKGITVYRDGSRGGVLVSDTNTSEEFKQYKAPKRPKELDAELTPVKIKKQYYYVFVGLFDKKPYEVFITEVLENDYNLTKKYLTKNNITSIKGKIIKIKKHHYSFKSDTINVDKLIEGNSELEKIYALSTSMLLRHGADIHHVIKTAKKIDTEMTSFIPAMCRVLSKYDNIKEELVCEQCGGKVIKESGCQKCLDCGNSKCD